jgi:hypothetical protein
MSEKSSFFAELKRRNVYKVAVAYAVLARLLFKSARRFLRFSKHRTGSTVNRAALDPPPSVGALRRGRSQVNRSWPNECI